MELLRQVWALTWKNLLHLVVRRWFSTPMRALILPVIFVFIFSWSKHWVYLTVQEGVGSPHPIRTLSEAFAAGSSVRNKFVIIDNGFKTGDISEVIHELQSVAESSGMHVHRLTDSSSVRQICPGSVLGITGCFGGVEFRASPNHPEHAQFPGIWEYTLLSDAGLNSIRSVFHNHNNVQIYILPLQHAIDSAISRTGGYALPDNIVAYPYTQFRQSYDEEQSNSRFQSNLGSYLAVAFFVGMLGITYQLPGFMALEREKGLSQLIEAMMPNKKRWQPQAVRLLSYHLAFDIIYAPSWILIAITLGTIVFPKTGMGLIVGWHMLAGLSLTSYSIFAASAFRKAQLSGMIVVVISFVLAVAAQFGFSGPNPDQPPSFAVIVTAALFPPMTYTYMFLVLVSFQYIELPISLSKSSPSTLLEWSVPGVVFLGLMAVQSISFLILAMLLERSIHGTTCKNRKLVYGTNSVAAWTEDFSKHYDTTTIWGRLCCCLCGSRSRVVKAVNGLSLQLARGSITVLLGANGSGKTTTLSAISGTTKITSGTVYVDGSGGLGLCPQRNVLWDDLTVYEHVTIFDLLKSLRGSYTGEIERKRLIFDCDLATKTNSKAKTLSGGQKRKLQLAIMFVGGSSVCCVDEVSSGIDPLARRKIWDILLTERGKRTIILTTHFMDEADVIADHIAIMSKGFLKAEGSAAQLKHALGNGFEIVIPETAIQYLGANLSNINYRTDCGRTFLQIPHSSHVAAITTILEAHGCYDYQVQSPTIEDVFLSLAEEVKDSLAQPAFGGSSSAGNSRYELNEQSVEAKYSSEDVLSLTTGREVSFTQQVLILLKKRFVVLRTQYLSYPCALLLPILTAYLVTYFLRSFPYPNGIPCSNYVQSGLEAYPLSASQLGHGSAIYGPPSAVPIDRFAPLFKTAHVEPPASVDTMAQFTDRIKHRRYGLDSGGFFIGQDYPIFAYEGQIDFTGGLVVQAALDNVLGSQLILPSYAEFSERHFFGAFQSILLVLFMALALCVFPAILGLYPSRERLQNVRALQYTNGIRSAPLWTAHILFDSIFIILISLISVGIWISQYSGWYNIGAIAVIFILFGLASTAFSYGISLFAKSPLACFAFASAIQCAVLLLCYAGYLLTEVYAPADRSQRWNNIEYFTIALITPTSSLLRALLSSLDEFSLLCRGEKFASYAGAMDIYGGPILYLFCQFILYMVFVIYWDGGGRFSFLRRIRKDVKDLEEKLVTDTLEDPSRLSPRNDGLRVLDMSKSYGNVRAVENVSFGVRKSENFALLGPNGAGKSTLISLIRGDFRPTGHGGDVFISGHSLALHRAVARSSLGTCPQFDAIDAMTVIEHLRFYARARGVTDVERNAKLLMNAVGLSPYETRMAGALSGGNKRKLSLAISLVGNPAVLILDEPSSGMDAAAKRVMWRVLSALSTGRALVITTHSMEEADTLCERAGIMAGRMLALGKTEELRHQYSNSSYVHLIHRQAPHTSDEQMEALREWLAQIIPEAVTERRMFGGQLRFSVRNGSPIFVSTTSVQTDRCSAGSLFRLLENRKDELQISQYTVGAATLDQVFLSVITQHNVEEENYSREN